MSKNTENIEYNSIIGRKNELDVFQDRLSSPSAEFIAVYGRRRVGKTYLIKHFFSQQKGLFFEQTGLNGGSLHEQLEIFANSFSNAFYKGIKTAIPKTWKEAFTQLNTAIESTPKNKRITLFFDELPWLASPRSGFLKMLEYFWNTAWAHRKKMTLLVCGSAASWMLENIIYAKGGLHNRITARIPLAPFTLSETEEYLHYLGVKLNQWQILQLYMVMGGVPHYLKSIRKNYSAVQNINALCFKKGGLLFDEFEILFHSLYDHPEDYHRIIRVIAQKTNGISREELAKKIKVPDGGYLNTRLRNLEEAGFINSFLPVGHTRRGVHYRVVDEYTLFYFTWIQPLRQKPSSDTVSKNYWETIIKKPTWLAWAGYAFESICFKHIDCIKKALGIEYIHSICSDWRYQPEKMKAEKGAQIDLVFDRDDDCVTLCEIKYSDKPFAMTKEYVQVLKQKEEIYKQRTRCKKQIYWALITANGVVQNDNLRAIITHHVDMNDLFN